MTRLHPDEDDPAAAARRYEALHADRTADVAFYVEEARCSGGPVLELGCGTGRVALAVAAAGIGVVGLDADPARAALAEARRRAADPAVRARARFLAADLRAPAVRGPFARVFLPFRVFQHLLDVSDQRAALRAARELLGPGGRLVFDVFDPDPEILAEAAGGDPTPLAATGRAFRDADGSRVVEKFTRCYDPLGQRIEQTFVYERFDPDGSVVERAFEPLSIRCFFRYEIEHLLARAGYEVEALFGGWRREPVTRPGGDLVWIARPEV